MSSDEFDDRQGAMAELRRSGVLDAPPGAIPRLIDAVRDLRNDRDQAKATIQDLRARVKALEDKAP